MYWHATLGTSLDNSKHYIPQFRVSLECPREWLQGVAGGTMVAKAVPMEGISLGQSVVDAECTHVGQLIGDSVK